MNFSFCLIDIQFSKKNWWITIGDVDSFRFGFSIFHFWVVNGKITEVDILGIGSFIRWVMRMNRKNWGVL